MLPSFKAVGGFLNRNRNKILIASVVAISVAIYMHYNSNEELLANNTNENDVEEESLDDDNNDGVKKRTESPLQINSPGNKARILLRLRREFDITAQCFLPTLRTKIMEVVDINESVRAIKELRTKSSEQNNEPAIQLWEEVKISAFQMMFVSSYMLCAMCILLRVQLCLLTRVSNRSGSAGNVGMDDGTQFDTAMFNLLVDNTFKHLYGSGLRTFSAMVKHRVMLDLKGWVVKEQGAVTFGELQQTVTSLRQAMETDLPATIQTIFIPPTALVGGIQPLNGLHNGNGTSGRDSPEATVQKLLDQTWDLVESPLFASVFTECLDAAFRHLLEQLRHGAFLSPTQASIAVPPSLRPLPLANLLPQIKNVTARLIPSKADQPISADIRAIVSGPCLESFCMSIFDSINM